MKIRLKAHYYTTHRNNITSRGSTNGVKSFLEKFQKLYFGATYKTFLTEKFENIRVQTWTLIFWLDCVIKK